MARDMCMGARSLVRLPGVVARLVRSLHLIPLMFPSQVIPLGFSINHKFFGDCILVFGKSY